MADRLSAHLAGALCLLVTAAQAVESLPDPTRPPGVEAAASGTAVAAADLPPVLTGVIITAAGPRAVIGGKALRVGERVGERKIVRITESAVVLSGAQGRETLLLTPGVEKKMLGAVRPRGRAGVEKP